MSYCAICLPSGFLFYYQKNYYFIHRTHVDNAQLKQMKTPECFRLSSATRHLVHEGGHDFWLAPGGEILGLIPSCGCCWSCPKYYYMTMIPPQDRDPDRLYSGYLENYLGTLRPCECESMNLQTIEFTAFGLRLNYAEGPSRCLQIQDFRGAVFRPDFFKG